MPTYHFILKPTNGSTIIDRDGEEFADERAAHTHAIKIAREIMRNREMKCRAYRLEICDENLEPCVEILFASIDDTLDHLSRDCRSQIEEAAHATASLKDAVAQVKMTLSSVRKTLNTAEEILMSTRFAANGLIGGLGLQLGLQLFP